jgi:hypothetical protein
MGGLLMIEQPLNYSTNNVTPPLKNLPQPSPERLAEAINKFLIPALQKQPRKKEEKPA